MPFSNHYRDVSTIVQVNGSDRCIETVNISRK